MSLDLSGGATLPIASESKQNTSVDLTSIFNSATPKNTNNQSNHKHGNILVIGSGGREHAIVWKLSQSSKLDQSNTIYVAPVCIDIYK